MLWIKRVFWLVTVVLAIVLTVVISGLNTAVVTLDLYFWQFEVTLGVAVLLSLLAGLLLGLLFAALSYVLPLKSRQRRLQRQLKWLQKQQTGTPATSAAEQTAPQPGSQNPAAIEPPA